VITPSNRVFCENIQAPTWNELSDFSLKDTIDLWRISISDHLNSLAFFHTLLSQEELERVNRYHQKKDKDRFSIGKGMLRIILGNYLGSTPKEIMFKKGVNNKPFVDFPGNLQFNVSYSSNWIVLAVSSDPVGLDIEFINEDFSYQLMLENCFTKEEIGAIDSFSKPLHAFFKFWTRKEALLKATSWGLYDQLKDFSCLEGFQLISKKLSKNADWQIKSFIMENEYYLSLATNSPKTLRYCNNSYSFIEGAAQNK
jgi:4'-phosphopantetheinyl transferase